MSITQTQLKRKKERLSKLIKNISGNKLNTKESIKKLKKDLRILIKITDKFDKETNMYAKELLKEIKNKGKK